MKLRDLWDTIRFWLKDRRDSLFFRLYKTTDHYFEGQMHDTMLHSLLDDIGAPRHPGNDPQRPAFGVYGRLQAFAKKNGYTNSMQVKMPGDLKERIRKIIRGGDAGSRL